MTGNISSLVSLKHQFEYEFKKKLYWQQARIEEHAKCLTEIAFAEIFAYFSSMNASRFEAEFEQARNDRMSIGSMVSNWFTQASLDLSAQFIDVEALKKAKMLEFQAKKEEVEDKINLLKSSLLNKESSLISIEEQLKLLDEQTENIDDISKLEEIENNVNSIQETIEKDQKEIKIAVTNTKQALLRTASLAGKTALGSATKVLKPLNAIEATIDERMKIREEKILKTKAILGDSQLQKLPPDENSIQSEPLPARQNAEEAVRENTQNASDVQPENEEHNAETVMTKAEYDQRVAQLKETINASIENLNKMTEEQNQLLETFEEAYNDIEEFFESIGDIAEKDIEIDTAEVTASQAVNLSSPVEALRVEFEKITHEISRIQRDFTESKSDRKKKIEETEKQIIDEADTIVYKAEKNVLDVDESTKEKLCSDDIARKFQNKVVFVNCEIKSVEKLLESCRAMADSADKIVVDKHLTDVYSRLSSELGEDKVVLDRRDMDRRQQTDRRADTAHSSPGNRKAKSDRRESNDRRQLQSASFMAFDKLNEAVGDDMPEWFYR